MDHTLMYISNLDEIQDEVFPWPYPMPWDVKSLLPPLSRNTNCVKRGIKCGKLYRKLFQTCSVSLPNLSKSINHYKLFKKPMIYLQKSMCVPKINLRVWPEDYPHFKRYINGLYLIDYPIAFQIKGKRSTDEDSYQVNVGNPPLAYISLRRQMRKCNDFLSQHAL